MCYEVSCCKFDSRETIWYFIGELNSPHPLFFFLFFNNDSQFLMSYAFSRVYDILLLYVTVEGEVSFGANNIITSTSSDLGAGIA
jgi:hypothetical protein